MTILVLVSVTLQTTKRMLCLKSRLNVYVLQLMSVEIRSRCCVFKFSKNDRKYKVETVLKAT